ALGERGSEQLLGIPPARVAPEGRVGTARDGLRPAGLPSPVLVPVPGPADRHLMITAVLPVSAGAAAPVAGPGDRDVITVGSDHAGPPPLPDASLPRDRGRSPRPPSPAGPSPPSWPWNGPPAGTPARRRWCASGL